jgi:hypothetical protein
MNLCFLYVSLRDLLISVDMFRLMYLCSSPNPIKSSTVKGIGRGTCMREKIQCVVGNMKERVHLEDLGVDGR